MRELCAQLLGRTLIASFMGPIWGRQDPGGPRVGPFNFFLGILYVIYVYLLAFKVADTFLFNIALSQYIPEITLKVQNAWKKKYTKYRDCWY